MPEIALYRGQRKDNGEWVEGYYVRVLDTHMIIPTNLATYARHPGWTLYFNRVEVIPETVGQYSNLTDKNGKGIFAGDIVLALVNGEEVLSNVYFADGGFTIDTQLGLMYLGEIGSAYLEIIGTVHENPELLKEKP